MSHGKLAPTGKSCHTTTLMRVYKVLQYECDGEGLGEKADSHPANSFFCLYRSILKSQLGLELQD